MPRVGVLRFSQAPAMARMSINKVVSVYCLALHDGTRANYGRYPPVPTRFPLDGFPIV